MILINAIKTQISTSNKHISCNSITALGPDEKLKILLAAPDSANLLQVLKLIKER